MLVEQNKTTQNTTKTSNAPDNPSNINKLANDNKSRKKTGILEKGEKEKEIGKTKGKKCSYERRKEKRIITHNELKEGNREKEHRKGNKN